MLVELSKPFTPPGADKPVEALELKLEELTGAHVLKATNEANMKRGGAPAPSIAVDVPFHVEIAALASGIDAEALAKLPAKDFIRVQVAVQGFLLDVG